MKNTTLLFSALLAMGSTGVYAQENTENNNVLENAIEDIKDLNDTGLYKPHLALMVGASAPVENGYDAAAFTSVEAGYQIAVPYGIGLEIATLEFEGDDKDDLSQVQLFVKGSYHFGGDTPIIKHSYVGLGLGTVYENRSSENFYGAIMPNIGFDHPFKIGEEQISAGVNLRYTATASNEADNYGLNGVVKYWF